MSRMGLIGLVEHSLAAALRHARAIPREAQPGKLKTLVHFMLRCEIIFRAGRPAPAAGRRATGRVLCRFFSAADESS